jgi:hypothetical protein
MTFGKMRKPMVDPEKFTVSNLTRYRLQSMMDTMYWFKERVKEFHSEFSEDLETLQMLNSLEDYPFNLLAELDKVEQSVSEFEKAFLMSKRGLRWKGEASCRNIRSTDLLAVDAAQLRHINAEFERVTSDIGKFGTDVGISLESRLADMSDCLWDYEIDAELDFVLRADDPGYRDESDNFLKSLKLIVHEVKTTTKRWEISGCDWPEGYEFEPLPHGRLFHALLKDYEYLSAQPPINLPDLFRIGGISCDLIVRYQFYYDMNEKKWVKKFSWTDSNRPDVTFVRGEDAS